MQGIGAVHIQEMPSQCECIQKTSLVFTYGKWRLGIDTTLKILGTFGHAAQILLHESTVNHLSHYIHIDTSPYKTKMPHHHSNCHFTLIQGEGAIWCNHSRGHRNSFRGGLNEWDMESHEFISDMTPKTRLWKGEPERRQGEQQQGYRNQTKLKTATHSANSLFFLSLHSSPCIISAWCVVILVQDVTCQFHYLR